MTAGMFQVRSDDRLGERGSNESTTDRDDEAQPEKGGGNSTSDRCHCACKVREQETGL